MNRRELSEGEIRILQIIQDHYGPLNTEDEIIFIEDGKAVIWIKDRAGCMQLMAVLSNLAKWRADGTIPSDEALLNDWLTK